jgi:triacylglycerol lipase
MIKNKNFSEQSALFARFSNLAYQPPEKARKLFDKLGYVSIYYGNDGSNAYVIEDDTDIIVVCRGTEVNEWSDVKADLSINLVPSRTGIGQVHRGFRTYTDKIWEPIKAHISSVQTKSLWLTGHSLGAAMATLMARRCVLQPELPTPTALFTFGSPRVGDRKYINEFNTHLTHHRWVNNGDIVTKVPFSPWYYHCGTRHHIGQSGLITKNIENKTKIMNIVKLCLSFGTGALKIVTGDAKDHSSDLYVQHLSFWSMNDDEQ